MALSSNGIPFDSDRVIFITDRGSNMKKALRDFTRINCFPHFLNNTSKEACKIDLIENCIKQCSDLVRYMKISGHNNELAKSLKSASPTRFNSNIMMVSSIIDNWNQLETLLHRENESNRIRDIDKTVLHQIKTFLEPFKEWSDFSETSKRPSLYAVWIAIDSIIKHCAVKHDDEHLTTLMKTKALCYIEKRFELHSYHRLTTFLHPNYKSLRFASKLLYDTTKNETKELLRKYPAVDSEETVIPSERRSSSSSTSTVESELSNYANDYVDEDEVDKYTRTNFGIEKNSDPAMWWSEKKAEFPNLSRLAIALHAIPASSTPSERAFSISGSIITEKRVNIDPQMVEDLMIIRSSSEKFSSNSIWK